MARAYRALTGINYVNKDTGLENRVEAGGKIEHMNDVAIKHELAAGNIEPWKDRDTDNVGSPNEEVEVTVTGNVEGGEE